MLFGLIGLLVGVGIGFLIHRWWAIAVAILLPVPLYVGVAFGLWGSGFGENWEYAVPIWIVPAVIGCILGWFISSRSQSKRATLYRT
jgi:hypothetical protein